jgi:hypothetical protein
VPTSACASSTTKWYPTRLNLAGDLRAHVVPKEAWADYAALSRTAFALASLLELFVLGFTRRCCDITPRLRDSVEITAEDVDAALAAVPGRAAFLPHAAATFVLPKLAAARVRAAHARVAAAKPKAKKARRAAAGAAAAE